MVLRRTWILLAIFVFLSVLLVSPQPRMVSHTGLDLARTLTIGNSLTAGVGASAPSRGYPALVDANFATTGRDFTTRAVGGATVLRWLQQYPHLLDDLPAYAPTTVVIMLGGNDYLLGRAPNVWAQHATRLVDRVRELAPQAQIVIAAEYDVCAYGFDCVQYAASGVCDIEGACLGEPSVRPTWRQYKTQMQQTASSLNVRLITIATPWPWEITPDRVHPNDAGHQRVASGLISAL